jgi:hypothetical protein
MCCLMRAIAQFRGRWYVGMEQQWYRDKQRITEGTPIEIGPPQKKENRRWRYLCKRPWRPISLWDVKAPTLSRKSAHRWLWGCQPHAPTVIHPHEDSWYSFLLESESTHGAKVPARHCCHSSMFIRKSGVQFTYRYITMQSHFLRLHSVVHLSVLVTTARGPHLARDVI